MEINMFYDLMVALTTALTSLAIIMVIFGEYIATKRGEGRKS